MIREYDFDRIRTRHGIAKIPFSIEFVPIKWDYARLDLIKQCWIVQTCILLDPCMGERCSKNLKKFSIER